MAVTKEDLRNFSLFVLEMVEIGKAGSLVELAGQWEIKRRELDGAENGLNHIDADTLKRLAEAFPDVEDEAKLRQACARRGGVTTAELIANAANAAEKAIRQ